MEEEEADFSDDDEKFVYPIIYNKSLKENWDYYKPEEDEHHGKGGHSHAMEETRKTG